MCGADHSQAECTRFRSGSPPRVRSRQLRRHVSAGRAGITSACAEQTRLCSLQYRSLGDHLRVCGADFHRHHFEDRNGGSPPRVRSRHDWCDGTGARVGITSACAEQTPIHCVESHGRRDHLRVCGADMIGRSAMARTWGSPPRVRSRLRHRPRRRHPRRITSACAEQTSGRGICESGQWDHLRVCGADPWPSPILPRDRGSPPRVRSRPPAVG